MLAVRVRLVRGTTGFSASPDCKLPFKLAAGKGYAEVVVRVTPASAGGDALAVRVAGRWTRAYNLNCRFDFEARLGAPRTKAVVSTATSSPSARRKSASLSTSTPALSRW